MSWDTLPEKYRDKADLSPSPIAQKMQRQWRGLQSKIAGEHFESLIEASLEWYKLKGVAEIEKTPEPMKLLSKPNKKGQFMACYTKAAQPDFKGTGPGGRSVVFEAKHTDSDKIEQRAVTDDQAKRLKRHHDLGAAAFVLVSFGLQNFYRVPWEVWRDMKAIYGRKHMKQAELEPYRVQYIAGVLKLLEGIELSNNTEKEQQNEQGTTQQ